jgi:hypothetical protein
MNRFSVVPVVLLMAAVGTQHARAASLTTYVASYGADTNESVNCVQATPCRTFRGALAVTSPGGDVIVIDSANYGTAQISQSVSIIAPEGVFAGVEFRVGSGIVVTNGSGSVTLKGLTFLVLPVPNGTHPGASGLVVGNFNGSVVVQDCNFSGFYPSSAGVGGMAIQISGTTNIAPVQAQIIDTVIHDGASGIVLTGSVAASVSHLRMSNLSTYGVYVADQGNGETDVSVSDAEWSGPSLAGGNAFQVDAYSDSAQLYIDHTVMTGGSKGVYAVSSGALAYVTVTGSTLSKTGVGLSTAGGSAEITFSDSTLNANSNGASNVAGGTLNTAGNNLFVGNGFNVAGSLTRVALQ